MANYNLNQLPSEAQIRKTLRKAIFGKYVFCPHCGSRRVAPLEKRYHCKKCRKKFSLTSCSWLKGAKIALTKISCLLWCWQIKCPPDQAQAIAAVSLPTVRHWYDKFRDNLPPQLLEEMRLSGNVQADECYRHGYSILGAKQEAMDGKPSRMVLVTLFKESVDKNDVVTMLSQKVKPESILRTDGGSIYRKIEDWWPVSHEFELHKKFEFAITSEIEGLWGNLFTFIRRMYHHVTTAKIEGIVNEFCFRQCFQDYFHTPEKYFALCLVKLARKNPRKFSLRSQPEFSFILKEKSLAFVPSCF
jgi:transposase-like protein